jgi:putative tryptophan/tyrosine transport system substrate-binding protein
MASYTGRRKFLATLGGAAVWPLAARAQQSAVPVIGVVNAGSLEASASRIAAFRKGLSETGYVEGQNVAVEYHWFSGQYDRLPMLMADLASRRVAVIAALVSAGALAAKAATTTIPIVFVVSENPVSLGLVASLARPGGNMTGINIFFHELVAKRLGLLHDLVPKAIRVALLVNPANAHAARNTGSCTSPRIANSGHQGHHQPRDRCGLRHPRARSDALFVAPDGFFISRRVQLATLAARHAIPATYHSREVVEVGGLMSYGTDIVDMYRQAGVYTGQILNGAKPGDLPVLQSTKFEFVINLQTARALGLDVPLHLQQLADEVIE